MIYNADTGPRSTRRVSARHLYKTRDGWQFEFVDPQTGRTRSRLAKGLTKKQAAKARREFIGMVNKIGKLMAEAESLSAIGAW